MGDERIPGAIAGHTNMDLDCLGSMALARHLFPGYLVVQSRHVHPVARPLVTMYRNHLGLVPSRELKGRVLTHMVVVDTRSTDRVAEYLDLLARAPDRIDVYDHHPSDSRDIPEAVFHESALGSNTTFLGTLLMEQGVQVTPDDATIALAGIFADTGSFTHSNVTAEDFRVAAFLMDSGASIQLVKTFLSPLRERLQVTTFHDVLGDLIHLNIRGHSVLLSYTELEGPNQGLSPVVEKIFEVEGPDAYFAVFFFKHNNSAVIISRSQKDSIELDTVMAAFGGGGHKKAASATLKGVVGAEVREKLTEYLKSSLRPAVTAEDLMTREVEVIQQDTSLMDAAFFLERINHTGCPVVDGDGELVGFITLRDIQKGRRVRQMHAPVKGYMTSKVISTGPGTTFREMEEILLAHNIGHLPILENGRILGIITRSDYLAFRRAEKDKVEALRGSLV
ncbi:MAG: CBS domain-containing protein [Gemmatimonadota bacterium]